MIASGDLVDIRKLMTPTDVAARIGMPRPTIYYWMNEEELDFIKIRQSTFIHEDALERSDKIRLKVRSNREEEA